MNFGSGKALGELKGTLKAQIDIIGEELGKVFKDIFSYRSIIRQLGSMGMGFLIQNLLWQCNEEVQTLEKELKNLINARNFVNLLTRIRIRRYIADVFEKRQTASLPEQKN